MPYRMKSLALFAFWIALVWAAPASALEPAGVFTDHMVLQRDAPLPIFGTAAVGAEVKVQFGKQTKTARAAEDGRWTVTLEPTPVNAQPSELVIQSGGDTLTLSDVLVGDVWLCSGQSNMAGNVNKRAEAAQDDYPLIRHFTSGGAARKRRAAAAAWQATTPQTVSGFTATGYFFGRELYRELDVPIGLIKAAVGGTAIEPWTPKEAHELATGGLYRRHIAPLVPFAIRGVIWYQGEANSRTEKVAKPYASLLTAMIKSWRKAWGQEELPFFYVQLPSIKSADRVYFLVREAMLETLGQLPRIGMSVNIDIDEGLHPASKHIMGRRLALLALRDVYGKQVVASGPLFDSASVDHGAIVCRFTETDGGLVCQGDKLTNFEIAGADGKFAPAEARIAGKTVVVSSKQVEQPSAVRYAWSNNPKNITLFNQAGLPASPFRTEAKVSAE